MRLKSLAALVSASTLLAACASYSGIAPQFKPLDFDMVKGHSTVAYANWPKDDGYRELNDPELTRLIEQALADSPNVQAATAKLNRSKAASGLAESALWPQIGASLATTRERFSERGTTPPPYAGTVQDINDLQVSGQWELDFFGKNRENLKASVGELRATEAEYQATRLLLANNVARNYYSLARLLAQHELAEQRARQRDDLARLVERRFKAGLDTRVELESAQGVIPENARDIAALDEQISLARHALAALIGQGPDAVNDLAPKLPVITNLALPDSLPADLLGHRADVVAARWRVDAATHGMASTKALFYPNINLRAFAGLSAIGFDKWLDSGSRQPGIGLAITLPIFDSDRLRNQYRSSAAQVDGAVASYNGTLLEALHDVADQLSTLQSLDTQISRQHAAQSSAERGYELALKRYKADISDRLSVLNVESNLIAQRRTAVDLQARWIDSRLRLTRALGGGFAETPADTTDSTAALPAKAPLAAN